MGLSKTQKLVLKRSEKALLTILKNELELRKMLYSPFNPSLQKYCSSKKDETTIESILDFIQYGQQRWQEYNLQSLVDRYSYTFGYAKSRGKK